METSPLPSLEGLRCFVAAARQLNFRRAAAEVGLSPAALSKRIANLEDELGARVFRRTTRKVTLTEAGTSLLPYAERAVAAVRDCTMASAGKLQAPPAELTLGTRHELGMSWVVPTLPKLRRARPELTVHLYFGSGADLVHRVASGELDCAVTSTRLQDPRLRAAQLHAEQYVFVGATRLLEERPFDTRMDASEHTLVDIDGSLPLFAYLRDSKGSPVSTSFEGILRMGTIAAIRALVLRGEGVAVLPEYFVARDLATDRLRAILPRVKPRRDAFRLITRANDSRQVLFEALADVFQSEPLR